MYVSILATPRRHLEEKQSYLPPWVLLPLLRLCGIAVSVHQGRRRTRHVGVGTILAGIAFSLIGAQVALGQTCVATSSQGCTPNVSLALPLANSTNLSVPLNNNFKQLDSIFGGLVTVPAFQLEDLNHFVFADQYSSVQAAIQACQPLARASATSGGSNGCTVWATSNAVNTALSSLDPGANSIPITLILGPFDFTATQITLRPDFHVIGSGYYTTITSVGRNAQNLFVIPQANNQAIIHVVLEDFRAFGASGNTSQEGLSVDVSGFTNDQFSYSRFMNLEFHGFKGPAVHLKGRPSDAASAIQFMWFENIYADRPTGLSPTLLMEGYNGQLSFESCEFDGSANGDGANNITLSGGTYGPTTIYFHNLTAQNGSVGIQFNGVNTVIVDGLHSEQTPTVFNVTYNGVSGGASNQNIHIINSYIAGTSATTAILSTTDGFATVKFDHNFVGGTPGAIFTGANAANVAYCENSGTNVLPGCYSLQPFRFSEQAAPTAAANQDICYGDSMAHALKCNYNNTAFFRQTQTVASGTAPMTTAAIPSGTCGSTVTVKAMNVATTDVIAWSFNAAPGANPGRLVVTVWTTAGNVNFAYCNAGPNLITPTAATLNWRVDR